jgi:hypothetical protein
MAERTGEYQESDLLDLQAEFRGEMRPAPRAPAPDIVSDRQATTEEDIVTVATSGLQVSVPATGAAVNQRLVALNERLSRLEASLAHMTGRIDNVQAQPPDPASDADAPWRSFLDLQKIVADRLDRR